jgi:predicted negative regulator of RcsB-dependent stress response
VDENLSEKEQIEQLAKWWDENKTYVITGLALGASILFGWNYYKNQKLTRAYGAAALHASLTQAVDSGNVDAATAAAQQLAGDFASTPYAQLAPLVTARLHIDNGDLDAAAAQLTAALSAPDEIAHVARLRLARVRLAQERPADALEVLTGASGQYAAMFAEVRGDAHAALGSADEARRAYDEALDSDGTAIDRNFVQMKADALGVGVASIP